MQSQENGDQPDMPSPSPRAVSRKEEALWLLEKLLPDTGINNVAFGFRVAGRLHVETLRKALSVLLHRYEVLRTVFVAGDASLSKQTLPPHAFDVEVTQRSISATDAHQALEAFASIPFRLDGSPLIRLGLFRGLDEDIVCAAVHHL